MGIEGKIEGEGKVSYEFVIRSKEPIRFEVGKDTNIYAVYCITKPHGDLCDTGKLKTILGEAVDLCKKTERKELAKAYGRLLKVLENSDAIIPEWRDGTDLESLVEGENE